MHKKIHYPSINYKILTQANNYNNALFWADTLMDFKRTSSDHLETKSPQIIPYGKIETDKSK
jgi:hypothetical protein